MLWLQFVETVGWTKGSTHLNPEQQPFWVSSMLDVFALLAALLGGVALVIVLLLRWLVSKLRAWRRRGPAVHTKKGL